MIAQHQRLLPAVRELITVGARHRVFRRSELAEEVEGCIGPGMLSPFAETSFPPAEEEPQPFLMLREAERELDLLARRDAALERSSAMQDAADPFLALRGYPARGRPGRGREGVAIPHHPLRDRGEAPTGR